MESINIHPSQVRTSAQESTVTKYENIIFQHETSRFQICINERSVCLSPSQTKQFQGYRILLTYTSFYSFRNGTGKVSFVCSVMNESLGTPVRSVVTSRNPQKAKCPQGIFKNRLVVYCLYLGIPDPWPCVTQTHFSCKSFALLNFRVHKNIHATKKFDLSWEDPLEEGVATHSSILAWRIPRTEEPGGLQSVGSQRVRHEWTTKHSTDFQEEKMKAIADLYFYF